MFDCIILAGGQGERFGKQKQFVEFKDKPLWQHVKDRCEEAAASNIITVGIDFPGGKTRQDSVLYGLHKVVSERVVILEAARPLVTTKQILEIANNPYPSVSFIAPAVETVLYKNEHLDRNKCQILQVPQAFDSRLLIEAHDHTSINNATDDTILMKDVHNIIPDLILGGINLYKVTYPHEIKLLEIINENTDNWGNWRYSPSD